jgi:hypothetical protein
VGKKAAANINYTLNSVAIEDELTSVELSFTQEAIKVDGLSSTGPERVVGNYDWGVSGEGNFDGAASQGDATIFALKGSAGVSSAFDPTGASAAANDPNYDGTVVLESYSIKGGVGQPVSYSVSLQGTSALSRAVA